MTQQKAGGRVYTLLQPVGARTEIVFAPFTLGDDMDWRDGKFRTVIDLITHKSGWSIDSLRELPYPDAGIILDTFVAYLPEHIRTVAISGENWPEPPMPDVVFETGEGDQALVQAAIQPEPREPSELEREYGDSVGDKTVLAEVLATSEPDVRKDEEDGPVLPKGYGPDPDAHGMPDFEMPTDE